MAKIPAKVSNRIKAGLKHFQPILAASKARDVGEADTVTLVKDILAGVFGYDKYSEITSEHSIRGTFCDLAIKLDGDLSLLLEVKAIGLDLKESHVKQAVDYAANQGVEWVVLTNAVSWRIYKLQFTKPIEQELVVNIDLLTASPKDERDIESLFLLCKEGWLKSVLGEYASQKQALSRFFLAAMVLSEPVLEVIRRELRRLSPDVRIEIEDIERVLATDVIKREITEGDKADEAKRKVARSANKSLRSKKSEPDKKALKADTAESNPDVD